MTPNLRTPVFIRSGTGELADAAGKLLPAIAELSAGRKTPFLIALDGRSGTGKSTLARMLAEKTRASVITCDDFYTGGSFEEWAVRSPEEKMKKCIDWRRLRTEVLVPLLAGQTASWRSFNWEKMAGYSEKIFTCAPAQLVILDGIYSGRPELSDLVNLAVLLRLTDRVRRDRLLGREGESFMSHWHPVWDEAEDYYFGNVRADPSWDIVIDLG